MFPPRNRSKNSEISNHLKKKNGTNTKDLKHETASYNTIYQI